MIHFWVIFKQCAMTSRLSGIKPSRHFISQKAKTDLWVVVTALDVHLLSLLAFWCSIHTVIQFGSLHTSGKESKVCIFSLLCHPLALLNWSGGEALASVTENVFSLQYLLLVLESSEEARNVHHLQMQEIWALKCVALLWQMEWKCCCHQILIFEHDDLHFPPKCMWS